MICLYCKKEIPFNPTYPKKKYCSNTCRGRHRMQKRNWRTRKEHDAWLKRGGTHRGIKEKRICLECGEEFLSNSYNQQYCTEKCRRKNEYFIRIYGKDFELYQLRYQLVKGLNKFRKELKDVREIRLS